MIRRTPIGPKGHRPLLGVEGNTLGTNSETIEDLMRADRGEKENENAITRTAAVFFNRSSDSKNIRKGRQSRHLARYPHFKNYPPPRVTRKAVIFAERPGRGMDRRTREEAAE